jgi:hypothetical protein
MSYRLAGIDVHKKMLAVVVADIEIHGEYQFEQRQFGSNPEHLRLLAGWLIEQDVEEIVMESTAQYWKPVWAALERYWKPSCRKREGASLLSGTLHLAQAQSNRGPRGRKKDFADAERLVKRLVANELILVQGKTRALNHKQMAKCSFLLHPFDLRSPGHKTECKANM